MNMTRTTIDRPNIIIRHSRIHRRLEECAGMLRNNSIERSFYTYTQGKILHRGIIGNEASGVQQACIDRNTP